MKAVELVGAFSPFELVLAFGTSAPFQLSARTMAGVSASPADFLRKVSGKPSVFPSGANAAKEVFRELQAVALQDVAVAFEFDSPSIVLRGTGTVFGGSFDVAVVAEKKGAWQYALAVTAAGLDTLSLPGFLGAAVGTLAPRHLMVSAASKKTRFGELQIPKGFSFSAAMPTGSGLIKTILDVSPGSLRSRVTDGSSGGEVTIVTALASAKDISLSLNLVGGVELGSPNVVLSTVALRVVLSAAAAPKLGFAVTVDVTMGSRVLSASAFLAASVTGLELGVSFTGNQPWERPFGIKGVAIHFPLAFKLGVMPAPPFLSEFALIGKVGIASTTGSLAMSVSLTAPTKSAFQAELRNFDLQEILVEVMDCQACTSGVGAVLTDMSVDLLRGSFNPDPVNAVSIVVADVSVDIPAGVSFELVNLDLWGVVQVKRAHFALNTDGVEAGFHAEKVDWGPITITSMSDTQKGPRFDLVLTKSRQALLIDGKATVLGQSVGLYLSMSDTEVVGHFQLSLGGAKVDARLLSTGTPGQPGFSSTVSATLEWDLFGGMVRAATQALLGLAEDAQKELQAAQAQVQQEKQKVDDAGRALRTASGNVQRDLRSAESNVQNAAREVQNFNCGDMWLISDICEIGKRIIVAILRIARATVAGVRKMATAVIKAAEVIVDESKILLDFANGVLVWAEGAVGVFEGAVSDIGGALEKMLIIHELTLTGTLSSSSAAVGFRADLTVFGKRVVFEFAAQLDIDSITRELKRIVDSIFNKDYDVKKLEGKPLTPTGFTTAEGASGTMEERVAAINDYTAEQLAAETTDVWAMERDCRDMREKCKRARAQANRCMARAVRGCRRMEHHLGLQAAASIKFVEFSQKDVLPMILMPANLLALAQAVLPKLKPCKKLPDWLCPFKIMRGLRTGSQSLLERNAKTLVDAVLVASGKASRADTAHASAVQAVKKKEEECAKKNDAACRASLRSLRTEKAAASLEKGLRKRQWQNLDDTLFEHVLTPLSSGSYSPGKLLALGELKKSLVDTVVQMDNKIARLEKKKCARGWKWLQCKLALKLQLVGARVTRDIRQARVDRAAPHFTRV